MQDLIKKAFYLSNSNNNNNNQCHKLKKNNKNFKLEIRQFIRIKVYQRKKEKNIKLFIIFQKFIK